MKRIQAQHGIVCRLADQAHGYFGWPSVARAADGTLLVVASGPRLAHTCPFGKVSIMQSANDGHTWSAPRVISDTPLDDRDAGIVCLGGRRLLVSSFTVDTRVSLDKHLKSWPADQWARATHVVASWTDQLMRDWLTPYVLLSDDAGATWSGPIRTPVSAPHGPILLRDSSLLYLGWQTMIPRRYPMLGALAPPDSDAIFACKSTDGGRTWRALGEVPPTPGLDKADFFEPHVVELPSGRLVALLRFRGHGPSGPQGFSLFQSESEDGGATWSPARLLGVYGSPPHLMRHSSGTLVCSYGYRRPPFGQRVMLSRDEGRTWDADWVLRDDGLDGDLGYPCSVELADGSIFAVYYQKAAAGEPCSLLWSRWRLP